MGGKFWEVFMRPNSRIIRFTLILLTWLILFIVMYPKVPHYEVIHEPVLEESLSEDKVDRVIYLKDKGFALVHIVPYEKAFKYIVVSEDSFLEKLRDYADSHEKFQFVVGNDSFHFDWLQFILLGFSFSFIVYWVSYAVERSLEQKETSPKYRKSKKDEIKVTFADVIGLEKQIEDILDVVKFLKEPEKYREMGATLPKGILLYGPPGVGKTHIARAIAGEANVPFFHVSASELQSKWVGESEANIRRLFKTAKKHAPSVIYIDELDSIAVERFSESSNHNMIGVINQLLACMDGFSKDTNVMVIASTNHIESLDSAILRSGRFDRKILIHMPDKEARQKLISYYAKGKKLSPSIDMEKFLSVSAGLTGADIKTIMNEAALLSVRLNNDSITEEILLEAFRKVALGSTHTSSPIPKEKLRMIAIHEAGHAVLSYYYGRTVSEISIIARGNAAGYNLRSLEDVQNDTFAELLKEMKILLGGRAAEELFYDSFVSIGASDDLRRASSIAKDLFLRYGYQLHHEDSLLVKTDDLSFNQKLLDNKFDMIQKLMEEHYRIAKETIRNRKEQIASLAELLLSKETLSSEEIENFFHQN